VDLIKQYEDLTGIINIAGEKISRLQFARKIAEKFSLSTDLIREVESLSGFKAARPFDSSLDISYAKSILKTDFYSMEHNLEFLEETLIEEKK
jgi:dTDP-4-dehydrorhamnose reductase